MFFVAGFYGVYKRKEAKENLGLGCLVEVCGIEPQTS